MPKILIVDDDAELRETIFEVMVAQGFNTDCAEDVESALKKVENKDYDVILLDVIMPKISGIDALPLFFKANSKSNIIIMTAYSTVDNAVEAMKKGAVDYLTKPFKINELMVTIMRILEEKKFKACAESLDIDCALNTMSNSIRREILNYVDQNQKMRFMEITRALGILDHTKVNFHLKILKEAGYLSQNDEKLYVITESGRRILQCLGTIEKHLS
jgi:DNA-binding NtrC family response regulator